MQKERHAVEQKRQRYVEVSFGVANERDKVSRINRIRFRALVERLGERR